MNRTGWAWEGVKEELADKRAGFQVELACQAWAGLELEPGQAGAREVHCRMVSHGAGCGCFFLSHQAQSQGVEVGSLPPG